MTCGGAGYDSWAIGISFLCLKLQVDAIHYDDANQLLMVTKGGSIVFAYDLSMDAPGHHEQLVRHSGQSSCLRSSKSPPPLLQVWTYPVQDGPQVTLMRCSLDRKLLGCLR